MVDILVKNNDNIVKYNADLLSWNTNKLLINMKTSKDIKVNSTNYTIYKNVTLPNDFIAGCYTYIDGVFEATPQLADRIAEREAREAEELAQQSIVNAKRIDDYMKQIFTKHMHREDRYDSELKLIANNDTEVIETKDSVQWYNQHLKWEKEMRKANDSGTYYEIMTKLNNLDLWYPYTSQALYNADPLNERTVEIDVSPI